MIRCELCGITSKEYNGWVPCKRIGGSYLCWHCCQACDYHTEICGIWGCRYLSEEQLREKNVSDHRAEFQRELDQISARHWAKVRANRKKEAIIKNRRRAQEK